MGAWSDSPSIRSKAHTYNIGILSFQSVSIETKSIFSYVGSGRLFTQVFCLSIIETFLKSKMSKQH
jgi:hypothetical protein